MSAYISMQCDWWQILAHVSPLPDSRKALKDTDEFPGEQTEKFLQKTADCENKPQDCEGKVVDCEEDANMSHEGSQLFTYLLSYMKLAENIFVTRVEQLLKSIVPTIMVDSPAYSAL